MSLINKMLKDLETRQSGMQAPDPQSIYHGLRTSEIRPPRQRRMQVLLVIGGFVLAVLGGWIGWVYFSKPVTESPISQDTPPPTSPAAVMPTAKTETPGVRKPSAAGTSGTRSVAAAPAPDKSTASAGIELTGHPLSQEDQAENKYREAVQLVRQQRREDAEQRLRAALALNAGHVQAREALAALLVEQGRWLEAQAVLEEGLKQLPNQTSFGFLLARLYVEQGQDAAGLQLLERLQTQAGNNPDFIAFMATLYQRTGRHADAVNYFRQATSARPVEGRWWAGLGISLEAENDRENARAAYVKATALPLDPRLAEYVADRLRQLPNR